VCPALRVRDETVDFKDIFLHSGQDVQPIDDSLDIGHGGVVMAVTVLVLVAMVMAVLMLVVVAMVMAVVMLMLVVVPMLMTVLMSMIMLCITQQVSLQNTIDFYTHVSAGDAALDRRCGLEPDTGYTNRVQLSHALIFIGNNFQQGCCQHVTRSSHTAFKI
jgi:hypothetical protein